MSVRSRVRTLPLRLPGAPSSGLVVLVPEAEPVVGHLRDRLDPNAASGVGAHVTVLFPFPDPALPVQIREQFAVG
jgi:hypothetical protein